MLYRWAIEAQAIKKNKEASFASPYTSEARMETTEKRWFEHLNV